MINIVAEQDVVTDTRNNFNAGGVMQDNNVHNNTNITTYDKSVQQGLLSAILNNNTNENYTTQTSIGNNTNPLTETNNPNITVTTNKGDVVGLLTQEYNTNVTTYDSKHSDYGLLAGLSAGFGFLGGFIGGWGGSPTTFNGQILGSLGGFLATDFIKRNMTEIIDAISDGKCSESLVCQIAVSLASGVAGGVIGGKISKIGDELSGVISEGSNSFEDLSKTHPNKFLNALLKTWDVTKDIAKNEYAQAAVIGVLSEEIDTILNNFYNNGKYDSDKAKDDANI